MKSAAYLMDQQLIINKYSKQCRGKDYKYLARILTAYAFGINKELFFIMLFCACIFCTHT